MAVRPVLTMVMLAALSAAAWAQERNPEPAANRPRELSIRSADQPEVDKDAPARRPREDSQGGLWPTPKLMRLVLTRWADELSHRYELDDEQRAKVREQVVHRWQPFLDEHRGEVQPLINDMLEMRLGLAPPGKDEVREWAQRAAPVVGKLRRNLDEGSEVFSKILTPAQRTRFELDTLVYEAGMQLINRKLSAWQRGEYEEQVVWSSPGARRQRRSIRRSALREVPQPGGDRVKADGGAYRAGARRNKEDAGKVLAGKVPDQIALEVDVWTKYVVRFTRMLKLDDGQRTSVASVLDELKSRALSHRDRHRDEIAKLERRILEFGGSNEELAGLKNQLTELYGPVDVMFLELKRRIETVPTAAQRQAAFLGKMDVKERPAPKTATPPQDSNPLHKAGRRSSESTDDQEPRK